MTKTGLSPRRRTGCGMLLSSCLVTCLLLVVNRGLVTTVYAIVVPSSVDYARLRTVLQILLMILFLLPEWWLIDRAARLLGRLRRSADPENAAKKPTRGTDH